MPKHKSEHLTEQMKTADPRFTCKPLDSYSEILLFLENPPPWRTLCKELTPHSDLLIRNIEINKHCVDLSLEKPQNFCHFDPEVAQVNRHPSKSLPKTLLCHDMANGYHDDCLIEGTSDSGAYTFYNWAGIDIFCYFSHHLITIPPVGWINVGHAHGVKVIGTIITERTEGAVFWDYVLATEKQYQNVASALLAIAKSLKFDGYLLNIENKIAMPEKLLQFVRYFHRLLHDELPHATLIWYDSVTVQGNLSWQNKLSEKNMAFFEACDGLFTNYSWTPEDVAASARLAGSRITDLYIGVDVWGRNFYGGGQFNTQQAIKVVHAEGCSIALFAPAWTHEAMANERNQVAMAEDLNDYAKFQLRDRAFWGSLWPFLNTRLPCHIPFQTSFCRGQGNKRWLYGEVLSPSPWYNLRHQQYQPNAAHGPHGYLLTTAQKLGSVKEDVQFKDKKGIIRIRSSFLQARTELLTVNKESIVNTTSVDSTLPASSHEIVASNSSAKSSVGTIKDIFKPKPLKIVEPAEASASSSDQHSIIESQPSVNLRLSHKEVLRYGLAYVAGEHQCLEPHLDDAFTGGSCLKVHPSDELCSDHRNTHLFNCDFSCSEGLIFCVVTKNFREYPEQTLNVKLFMRNAANEELLVVLTGRLLTQTSLVDAFSSGINHVYPLRTSDEEVLRNLRTYLLLTQPGFYVPIDNQFGWKVRYFEIGAPGSRITSISLRTGAPSGPILLGHFGIWTKSKDKSWVPDFQSPLESGAIQIPTKAMPYNNCVAQ